MRLNEDDKKLLTPYKSKYQEMARQKFGGFVIDIYGGKDTTGPGRKEHGFPHIVVYRNERYNKIFLRTLEIDPKPKNQAQTENLTSKDLKLFYKILLKPSDTPLYNNWQRLADIWNILNNQNPRDKINLKSFPRILRDISTKEN